jgi:hypothetical protein
MKSNLKACLNDLERRLSDTEENRIMADWRSFTHGAWNTPLFLPARSRPNPPGFTWPVFRVNEAQRDYEAMAIQSFSSCSLALERALGHVLAVRCNYGTGIMPSLFGAELFMMADEQETLPTTVPIPGGLDSMRRLLDRGVPDLQSGLGGKVFRMAEFFLEAMAPYAKVKRYVTLYHPDLQGPLDVVELLWGSGLFLDLVDHPDEIKALLDLVTETYLAFMRKWLRLVPYNGRDAAHWGILHKGCIMLRDDSAMNLSPDMFDEFVKPYDQRLLDELGGGAIHFCGRGDHYIARMTGMRNLHAIAMSQPHLNDMEIIYRHTVDRGIKLLGFNRKAADAALAAGRDLRGHVQSF